MMRSPLFYGNTMDGHGGVGSTLAGFLVYHVLAHGGVGLWHTLCSMRPPPAGAGAQHL